jgi:hypothetical protein
MWYHRSVAQCPKARLLYPYPYPIPIQTILLPYTIHITHNRKPNSPPTQYPPQPHPSTDCPHASYPYAAGA